MHVAACGEPCFIPHHEQELAALPSGQPLASCQPSPRSVLGKWGADALGSDSHVGTSRDRVRTELINYAGSLMILLPQLLPAGPYRARCPQPRAGGNCALLLRAQPPCRVVWKVPTQPSSTRAPRRCLPNSPKALSILSTLWFCQYRCSSQQAVLVQSSSVSHPNCKPLVPKRHGSHLPFPKPFVARLQA